MTETYLAKEKLGKRVTVRESPNASSLAIGFIDPYDTFSYIAIVNDEESPDDPTKKWLELMDGDGFVNYIYPPNGLRVTLITQPGDAPQDEFMAERIVVYYRNQATGEVATQEWIPA